MSPSSSSSLLAAAPPSLVPREIKKKTKDGKKSKLVWLQGKEKTHSTRAIHHVSVTRCNVKERRKNMRILSPAIIHKHMDRRQRHMRLDSKEKIKLLFRLEDSLPPPDAVAFVLLLFLLRTISIQKTRWHKSSLSLSPRCLKTRPNSILSIFFYFSLTSPFLSFHSFLTHTVMLSFSYMTYLPQIHILVIVTTNNIRSNLYSLSITFSPTLCFHKEDRNTFTIQ